MERFDLTRVEDRLALVDRVFTYPDEPHLRKHGPHGYSDYESYRDWLRDEFSYRCVFSLFRETWRGMTFHIDHLISQKDRPDLICEYDNLLYLNSRLNLVKGKKRLPDPSEFSLAECLFVYVQGERMGEIEAKNEVGELIINVLKLDNEDATATRKEWLGILRSVAQTDEVLFRKFIGYPERLPNLTHNRIPNSRPNGLKLSAHYLKDNGLLPEWI